MLTEPLGPTKEPYALAKLVGWKLFLKLQLAVCNTHLKGTSDQYYTGLTILSFREQTRPNCHAATISQSKVGRHPSIVIWGSGEVR